MMDSGETTIMREQEELWAVLQLIGPNTKDNSDVERSKDSAKCGSEMDSATKVNSVTMFPLERDECLEKTEILNKEYGRMATLFLLDNLIT
jgi:hypothetical protein